MLADSQTYSICSENFMRIGQAVSEEFNHARRDTRILCIRLKGLSIIKLLILYRKNKQIKKKMFRLWWGIERQRLFHSKVK